MNMFRLARIGMAAVALSITGLAAAGPVAPMVRIAELRIKPSELDRYKAAVREEIF